MCWVAAGVLVCYSAIVHCLLEACLRVASGNFLLDVICSVFIHSLLVFVLVNCSLPLAFLLGLGPACRCTHIVSELFKKRRHASPVWHLLPTSCCLHRRRKCESQFNCTLSLLDFCPAHRGAQSSSANKIHKLIGQAYWHQGPYCGSFPEFN